MKDKVNILTPVGRIVSGDCFQGNDKDAEGRPLVVKSGPNMGQPRMNFYIGVAIAKTEPEFEAVRQQIYQVAQKEFPHLFDANGTCLNPEFAFKITDGDSPRPNTKGKRPCDQEGYPGHWILNFSNGFAPKCYTSGGAQEITDSNALKRGYYVRVYASIKGNESNSQPGIYLNHSMVELIGYGEEIISGPSGIDVFGGKPAAMPPGASTTPIAGEPIASQAPAAPTPGGTMAPAAPTPGGTMAPAAPTPGGTMAPPQIPQPAPEALEPPVKYSHEGVSYTKEQLLGYGWNEQQIESLPRA